MAAKTQSEQFYTLYYLAIATGMRQGEMLGFKWTDLDWEKGELQVLRQLTKEKGGGFELAAPKTRAGIRRIYLGKNTLMALEQHRQAQFLQMQAAGIH